jgi:hypothetical protein
VAAEKTLKERVTDLERLLPAQIRALSRLNDQETATIRADIATIRAQMLAGFASLENRLTIVEQDLSEIKQTLDALPRVLAGRNSQTSLGRGLGIDGGRPVSFQSTPPPRA